MSDGKEAATAPLAVIEPAPPVAMVTLRCAHAEPRLAVALAGLGLPMPGQRRIETAGARRIAWMSPDELLLILPPGDLAAVLDGLQTALAGVHHLAVDVSDARAMFHIRGPRAREVLAKLCPVDLAPAAFGPGEIRRSRAAQVSAAFWMTGSDAFALVCFRSVADYVVGLLEVSARPGGELGLW